MSDQESFNDPAMWPQQVTPDGQLRTQFDQLSRERDELRRSNEQLQQFVQVAAHELNGPLRAVSGFCQLLKVRHQEQLNAEANECLDYAVQGAELMRQLIDGLLHLSRVGARPRLAQTDLSAAMDAAVAQLQLTIQEAGAEVTRDELPTLKGDDSLLVPLFRNLISNAIKFRSNDYPRVHVSAAKAGPQWMISVRDNGIGMDSQHADRIFEMFTRLHGPTKYPGSGIGLALCKKIVEGHGGRIWVESELGKGSVFKFTLSVVRGRDLLQFRY